MATFGHTALDGDTSTSIEGVIRFGNFTCPTSGTPQSITIRFTKSTTDASLFKLAVYDATDESLVATTVEGNSSTSGFQNVTLNVASVVTDLVAAREYRICGWANNPSGVLGIGSRASLGSNGAQVLAYDGNYPDPLVPDFPGSTLFDIYVTYDDGLGGGGGQSMPPYVL